MFSRSVKFKINLLKCIQSLSDSISSRTRNSIDTSRVITPTPTKNITRLGYTGIVHHPDMKEHRCLWDSGYEECPERFTRTLERLRELGLEQRCMPITPRAATEQEILTVHEKEYIEFVKGTKDLVDETRLEQLSSKFDAVYFHPETYDLALLAAGSAIDLTTEVVEGRLRNGFALIRPPGHHALKAEACGYCIFNNVALAAKHAVDNLGLERVLIVDWDVHHGQATQYTFDADPRVLYISIHRYEHGAFWPELIESNSNWIGIGEGLGFNCNIPLNEIGINDKDYLTVFNNVILPLAYKFNPQLVLISAGYDSAIGCPEGQMLVSPATYAHMCHSLQSLAGGKVCVLLEGGYCLSSLAESAAMTLRSLLGDPCPPILPLPSLKIHKSLIASVLDTIWALRPHWEGVFPLQGFFDRLADPDVLERPRHFPVVQYNGKAALLPKPESYPTRNCYPVQADEEKIKLANQIQQLVESTDLSNLFLNGKRCCLAYNELMTAHKCPGGSHPERPTRITNIFKYLVAKGLVDECILLSDARYASDEELLLVHSSRHIEETRRMKGLKQNEITKIADTFDSIYMNKSTDDCARLSAGSLLNVVDAVMNRTCLNGMAVIRPPGHHAARDKPAGFCIYNNVAIAAKYVQSKYNVKKTLIVDFDVHHGDGTQSIVQNDENILFISIHRYESAAFYPATLASGIRQDATNVINIPWNNSTMGPSEYISALLHVILPAAYDFDPDLVLVSAGFDAAVNDPLGQYEVTPQTYGHFIHHLSALAGGKVIVSLEGGYNLESICAASFHCLSALVGIDPVPLNIERVDPNAQLTLQEVVDFHSSRWPSLQFGVDLPFNDS